MEVLIHAHTSEDIARIAEVCHEADRAYLAALADFSVPHWDRISEAHRNTTMAKVAGLIADPQQPRPVFFESLSLEHKRKFHLFRAVVLALTALE